MPVMSETIRNNKINIIFRNPFGEINRITVSSDREAQDVVRERVGLGDIPVASTTSDDATNLTEKYRIQESDGVSPLRQYMLIFQNTPDG
jgi:hypothetical protein